MKIAVLGGSFDPPHIGHALIAAQVKEHLPVDEIWLVPCFRHTFNKKLSGALDRLAMTRFLETHTVKASDFEIMQKSRGATIETLRLLSKKFPRNSFSFIIGSDQLTDFHKWDEWQSLVKDFPLIVFPREIVLGKLAQLVKKTFRRASIPKNVVLMEDEDLILTNVSSTKIRDRVRKGRLIDYMVPKGVAVYIKKHRLYE